MGSALSSLGLDVTSPHVRALLRRYDSGDRDGKLDLREFLVLVRDLHAFQRLAVRAEAIFVACDVDGSGDISLSELQQSRSRNSTRP